MSGHQQEDPSKGKLMDMGQGETLTAPPSRVIIGPAQDTDLPSVLSGRHHLRPALP